MWKIGSAMGRRGCSSPSSTRSARNVSASVNLRAVRPTAAAASTLRAGVVDEHRALGRQPEAFQGELEDGRVGLDHPLDPGDQDVLEALQDAEPALRVREGLGRPVGQGDDPDAGLDQLGHDGPGARHHPGQRVVEVRPVAAGSPARQPGNARSAHARRRRTGSRASDRRFQPAKSIRSISGAIWSAGSTRRKAPTGSQVISTPPRSKITAGTRRPYPTGCHGHGPVSAGPPCRLQAAWQRLHPVADQPRPASPDFSGWNWVRPDRALLDGGHEPVAAVLGPGDPPLRRLGQRAHRRSCARSRTARPRPRRTARCPAGARTVFQPMCGSRSACSSSTRPGQIAAAVGPYAVLDAGLEQHLVPDADGQRRPARGPPLGDDLRPAHGDQSRHAGREGADARDHQTVGGQRRVRVGGHRRPRPRPARPPARPSAGCPTRSPGRRPTAHSSALGAGHALHPRVERDASRRARATALNWHSTMWCGSRPASSRDVQAEVGVEGQRLQHVPGQRPGVRARRRARRRSARTPGRPARRCARSTAARTRRPPPGRAPRPAAPARRRTGGCPALSPSAAPERLAEHDRGVLDRVVGVDVHVADRCDVEVDQRVPGQRGQHVVVEADAGGDRRTGRCRPGRGSRVTLDSDVVRSTVAVRFGSLIGLLASQHLGRARP